MVAWTTEFVVLRRGAPCEQDRSQVVISQLRLREKDALLSNVEIAETVRFRYSRESNKSLSPSLVVTSFVSSTIIVELQVPWGGVFLLLAFAGGSGCRDHGNVRGIVAGEADGKRVVCCFSVFFVLTGALSVLLMVGLIPMRDGVIALSSVTDSSDRL